ncbi:hypothetical protein SDC9_165083 [bioreactor metagenome]|uniref:Uncharacterized protein n=1 Tax=bioreactor metagenome TaxID=1076179 RepID=A0A645FTF0_9ZZZZ
MDIGIAQSLQALRRPQSHVFRVGLAAVIHHHTHRLARHQSRHIDFKAAIGQRGAVEQMRLAILAMLAHIQHGDFLAIM